MTNIPSVEDDYEVFARFGLPLPWEASPQDYEQALADVSAIFKVVARPQLGVGARKTNGN